MDCIKTKILDARDALPSLVLPHLLISCGFDSSVGTFAIIHCIKCDVDHEIIDMEWSED